MRTKPRASLEGRSGAGQQVRHPLLDWVPTGFDSFDEWKAEWDKASCLAVRLGLLHLWATERNWMDQRKQVMFLLDMADGHASAANFVVASEPSGYSGNPRHENSLGRQAIAQKAFSLLCLHFFSEEGDRGPSWWWMLRDDELFMKVLWFLRAEGAYGLRNHRNAGLTAAEEHQRKMFEGFLHKFARLGWIFREGCYEYTREEEQPIWNRLVAARPCFIDVLRALHRLDWLNGQELDDASLAKLQSLALCEKYSFPLRDGTESKRHPKTIEEAVLGGSVAGQVLALYDIRVGVRRHLLDKA